MPFNSEEIEDCTVQPHEIIFARTQCGLSQGTFAKILKISIQTLQQWEEGRRLPSGPTAILLKVLYFHPEMLKEAYLK